MHTQTQTNGRAGFGSIPRDWSDLELVRKSKPAGGWVGNIEPTATINRNSIRFNRAFLDNTQRNELLYTHVNVLYSAGNRAIVVEFTSTPVMDSYALTRKDGVATCGPTKFLKQRGFASSVRFTPELVGMTEHGEKWAIYL